MENDYEEGLLKGLGRIEHLGVIGWKDQATERLANAGIGVGLGFGVGILMTLIFPSFRMARSTSLLMAAAAGGLAAASAIAPVEGAFFDKLSLISGGFAGTRLGHAAIG